jgi:transcriptional regulator with XRE-family HTH domain
MAKALSRPATESFGERLRQLRTARGFTQQQLGSKVGISQRMVAYYETQGGTPAAPLVAKLAKALGVSTDEIIGGKRAQIVGTPQSTVELRLWRKLRQIQTLPEDKRRLLLLLIDEFLEKNVRPDAGEPGA